MVKWLGSIPRRKGGYQNLINRSGWENRGQDGKSICNIVYCILYIDRN